MSVNKVIIVGNLGADPEVRSTKGGQPVAELRVATSERWTDRDGQSQERTEWHTVTVWGKTAEHCGRYLTKGRQVYVEGRLQSREYEARDGGQRKVWEIIASRVVFLSGDGRGSRGGGGRSEPSRPAADWGEPSGGGGGGLPF